MFSTTACTHPTIMLFFSGHLMHTTISFSDITDYMFYNQTITFNGSYLVGDTQCAIAATYALDDNKVEGTESFSVQVDLSRDFTEIVHIFIIDNDCELTLSQGTVVPCI